MQKKLGVVRTDEVGQIIIPTEIREVLKLEEADRVEIYHDEKSSYFIKYADAECIFCSDQESLHLFKDKFICECCLSSI
jgi:AbrB family looped-hinge helix DNA binding protein